jgi:Rrf2 family protein
MASLEGGRPIPSHLVAQAQGIPERFLLKVLLPLVSAGVLRSLKGPNGGYQLARTPREISLLDIVEAIDGPIRAPITFEGNNGLANQLETIFGQANESVRRQFQKVRLSELATK